MPGPFRPSRSQLRRIAVQEGGGVKLPFAGGRTLGTPDTCEYQPHGRRCREPGAGELRSHFLGYRNDIPWTMCAEHVKPEHHPADLRDKLVKW